IGTSGSGFSVVHTFGGGATGSGGDPLILSGSTLYSMTNTGGTSGVGTIYKVNTDTTGFSVLHSFVSASEGSNPTGPLTISGSTLYGMTQHGGTGSGGALFQIGTSGSGFSVMHSFAGGASDGSTPLDGLTLSGSTLYGMTSLGGNS